MGYRIRFKKSVARDLRKLGKAEADRILTKLGADLPGSADSCPELRGRFTGLRRLRVGDYRVIFTIVGGEVLIARIGRRRDAYRD